MTFASPLRTMKNYTIIKNTVFSKTPGVIGVTEVIGVIEVIGLTLVTKVTEVTEVQISFFCNNKCKEYFLSKQHTADFPFLIVVYHFY